MVYSRRKKPSEVESTNGLSMELFNTLFRSIIDPCNQNQEGDGLNVLVVLKKEVGAMFSFILFLCVSFIFQFLAFIRLFI